MAEVASVVYVLSDEVAYEALRFDHPLFYVYS